jgi:predicted transcriptional regulator YheO
MKEEKKKLHPLIKSLIPLVKTIALTFGKNCEVVLHVLSDPQSSIVAIENGHVTGRKIGDPITDFALAACRKGGFGDSKEDEIINYKTQTKNGKILKSSSVFIRDQNNEIVGCLCLNYDLEGYLMFEHIMNEFCSLTDLSEQKEEETFVKDIDEILDNIISKAIKEVGKPVSLMQKEDNLRVVEIIEEKGGFMIKGAVDLLAQKLNLSRYTVYNYIDELKAKKKIQLQA